MVWQSARRAVRQDGQVRDADLYRKTGSGSGAARTLYLCAITNAAASGAPTVAANYGAIGTLGRAEQMTFAIPLAAVEGLANGTFGGLCLYESPYNFGASNWSANYMRIAGTDSSYKPCLPGNLWRHGRWVRRFQMYIAIPFEGRVRTLIRSSFVLAKRLSETTYNLSGDAFQMAQVTAEQALVFPDEAVLEEGTALTDELLMQALPLESFVSVSAEEALPNVLGLLLRTAVADGRISDEELLSVQPALEGRNWRANVAVQVGDVFTYKGSLWRCIQAHTTQGGWQPDKPRPSGTRWRSSPGGAVRVWEKGVAYAVGDVVAFPKEDGTRYTCIQAHTSQAGWQPPAAPALWKALEESEPLQIEAKT